MGLLGGRATVLIFMLVVAFLVAGTPPHHHHLVAFLEFLFQVAAIQGGF